MRDELKLRIDAHDAALRALLERLQQQPPVLKPAEAEQIAKLLEWQT